MEDQVALIAPIVAIAVFVQVRLQIFLTDRVIHSTNAALDEAPEALDGVGVNIAHDVDFGGVVDAAMRVA